MILLIRENCRLYGTELFYNDVMLLVISFFLIICYHFSQAQMFLWFNYVYKANVMQNHLISLMCQKNLKKFVLTIIVIIFQISLKFKVSLDPERKSSIFYQFLQKIKEQYVTLTFLLENWLNKQIYQIYVWTHIKLWKRAQQLWKLLKTFLWEIYNLKRVYSLSIERTFLGNVQFEPNLNFSKCLCCILSFIGI